MLLGPQILGSARLKNNKTPTQTHLSFEKKTQIGSAQTRFSSKLVPAFNWIFVLIAEALLLRSESRLPQLTSYFSRNNEIIIFIYGESTVADCARKAHSHLLFFYLENNQKDYFF